MTHTQTQPPREPPRPGTTRLPSTKSLAITGETRTMTPMIAETVTLRIGGTTLRTTCQTLRLRREDSVLLLATPHLPMTTTSPIVSLSGPLQSQLIPEQTTMELHTTPRTVLAPTCPTLAHQTLEYTVGVTLLPLQLGTTAMTSALVSGKVARALCLWSQVQQLVWQRV
jgi:hypothetical protein